MAIDQPEAPNTVPFGSVDNTDNPLKAYRTYSYYFFLVACDTTDYLDPANADVFADGTFFDRPSGNRRAVKADAKGIGQYVILIDSRQDVDYIIEDVEWGTAFVSNGNSSGSTIGLNTFLTDGQMKILEPRGVNFLNTLASMADTKSLNTDPSTMPFIMKVIFVGHKDDGSVDTLYNVPPFGVFFTEITGAVDANGTTYNLKYCGAVNGNSWNQTYDGITDGLHFTFKPGLSLEGHIEQFQAQLNSKYNEDRSRIIKNYQDATGVNLSDTCTIEWNLILESGGTVFPTLDDFGVLLPDHTQTGDKSYQYTGTKEGGVAELVNRLFDSSKKWNDIKLNGESNLAASNESSKRFSFQITTEFKKSSSLKGDNTIILNYIISEWSYTAVTVNDNPGGQGNVKPPFIDPANVYAFDYIFTGRNIDILRLDMNLSLGYALWLQLVTAQSLPSQTQDTTGTISQAAMIPTRPLQGNINPKQQIRKGTPIWPAAFTKEIYSKENQNQATVAAADAVWRNFCSYQAIQADLTIHGNPNLIQKITVPSRTSPDYVKVNVKMPATSDDIWEYNQDSDSTPGGYYKTFWFDGYYNIITAKNKFIGGQFTQELFLVAIPQISNDMTTSPEFQTDQDNSVQAPEFTFTPNTSTTPITPNLSITPPPGKGLKLGQATGSTFLPTSAPQLYYNFVSQYWNDAVNASLQVNVNNPGYPVITPDFLIAQAAFESNWGQGPLSQYNNLVGLKGFSTSPHNAFWPDGAVTPTAGKFRVYNTTRDCFGDQAVQITRLWSNVNAQTGAAFATNITDYVTALQNGPGGRRYDTTDPSYIAHVIDAYNKVEAAKAHLGITGTNLYQQSVLFSQPQSNPYLVPATTPFSQQTAPTPTKYSATDRSVEDATTAQKTLLSVGAGKFH